jgi:hypothetical protein
MSAPCDRVAERLAVGEPLAELSAHVETCPACARLTALPGLLAGASAVTASPALEPGAGFAARVTTGARGRLATRRRNRVLGSGAAVMAAAAMAALVMTRSPGTGSSQLGAMRMPPPLEPILASDPATDRSRPGDDVTPITDTSGDARLVRDLSDLSSLDRTLRPHRAWRVVERRFASTQRLLDQQQGVR